MALRIGEVGEPEIDAGDRRLRHDRLPTERFRPGEHGRRVIDLDIERGLAAAAFRAGVDPARQAAIAWFDQSAIGSGVWVAVADSPREHLAVELRSAWVSLPVIPNQRTGFAIDFFSSGWIRSL